MNNENWMKLADIERKLESVRTRLNRRINKYKRRMSLPKDVIGEKFIYNIYKDNLEFIENIDYKWITGEAKEIEEEYDRLYFSRIGVEKAIKSHKKAINYFDILIEAIYEEDNFNNEIKNIEQSTKKICLNCDKKEQISKLEEKLYSLKKECNECAINQKEEYELFLKLKEKYL